MLMNSRKMKISYKILILLIAFGMFITNIRIVNAETANFEDVDTEVTYETLAEAVNNVSDGATIKVLNDVDNLETAIINNKKITIDLNGKTLTFADVAIKVGVSGIEPTNAELVLKDSVGEGKISSSTTYAIIAYSNTTIDGGEVSGKTYALQNFSGPTTINDGILSGESGAINLTSGDVTINDGQLIGGSAVWGALSADSLTINGGIISGNSSGIFWQNGSLEVNGGQISGAYAINLHHVDGREDDNKPHAIVNDGIMVGTDTATHIDEGFVEYSFTINGGKYSSDEGNGDEYIRPICHYLKLNNEYYELTVEHDYDEPSYVWSNDNTTVTATRICKKDNTHVESETVNTTIEITKAPSESEDGNKRYTATFKNEAFATQVKDEVISKFAYNNTSGDGNIWYKGSNVTSDFTFKRSINDEETYSRFTDILIDNQVLDSSNYTHSEGSLVVKLKSNYLETLSLGDHTITAVFNDGKANAKFTISETSNNNKKSYSPPKTGIE